MRQSLAPSTIQTAQRQSIGLGVILAAAALAVGGLLALAGPLITVGTLLAIAAVLAALRSLEAGLLGAIAVALLLPFASLPFKVVFTPTFLDLALLAVVTVYLMQWMAGQRRRLRMTPAHGPLVIFIGLALVAFVAGQPNGPLTTNLIRQFGELLLNLALAIIVVDYVDSWDRLERLVRIVLLGGAALAAIGIVLYLLPADLSERLLSALRVFGYPSGGVLRYLEDNPDNFQRAIATSVDPNVLGGTLAMIGGLLAPQLLTRRPVLGRRDVTIAAGAFVFTCLVLTFSRGALLALLLVVLTIALLRYRKLLWLILAVSLLIASLPITADYVSHLVEGLRGQDLATQMRLGEYKDAFILISRYPVLGVGFAGAPEIDIYLGVSSAYLLMAESMGLVGLGAFAFVMLTVFGWAYARRRVGFDQGEALGAPALWLGAHAGLAAALAVGVVDHYFFRLNFQAAGTLFWLFTGLSLAATRLAVEHASVRAERDAASKASNIVDAGRIASAGA